ncbi:MAG TPA: YggT family protein [Pyrinomonadaceae bacterium]|nr:YggT family protein [Pyrinomonadaceae bacterium]
MIIFDLISLVTWYLVAGTVLGIIVVVIARVLVNYADMNPFTRTAMTIRQLSDPLINPVRAFLLSYRLEPKIAPFVTILLAILLGLFIWRVVDSFVFTIRGVTTSLHRGSVESLVGYILHGALGLYALMIIARVILSWGLTYGHRLMRFLIRWTDPILIPFRRRIPPVGMFDLSPMIVLIILLVFQSIIMGTLIR